MTRATTSSPGCSARAGCSISDREHALALLRLAVSELRALSAMLDPKVFDDSMFGFHAQQVAEKTLKAWISGQGVEYPRTHDLGLLLSILTDCEQAVDDLGHLIELNVFAVQFRYEAFEDLGEPVDRPAAISALQALVGRVEGELDSL